MKGEFSAQNMSRVARQAARSNGLSKVGSYDVVSHVRIFDYDDEEQAAEHLTLVIRAYSPGGKKAVDITAGDIHHFEFFHTDAPMARIA